MDLLGHVLYVDGNRCLSDIVLRPYLNRVEKALNPVFLRTLLRLIEASELVNQVL